MRKQLIKRVAAGVAVVGVAVAAFGTVGSAQTNNAANGKGIVGAWEVAVAPNGAAATDGIVEDAFVNHVFISSDGTVVNTGPFAKGGIGVWEQVDKLEYQLHVVHPIDQDDEELDPQSVDDNWVYDIVITVVLDKDGQQAKGEFKTRILAAHVIETEAAGFDVTYVPTGIEFYGEVEYHRMSPDSLVD